MSLAALETYLEPLKNLFAEEGVNEISINRPAEAWVEKRGDIRKEVLTQLDFNHLRELAQLVAQSTEQTISEETPILSATLPTGFRIQIVIPPACEPATIGMSIRKPSSMNLDLDCYEKLGAFDNTAVEEEVDNNTLILKDLLIKKDIKNFLLESVLRKKNIIISGGTSTGKTTFTNAMLRAIPVEERIITCEDAREIDLKDHPNRMHLLAS
ncbi:MAG: ATPase, T2SS/T4P/T4SS family, partial [Candidatus Midichloria sp.]